MNIDLTTFVSSIAGSAITASLFGYVLKKMYDETLRMKLQEYTERSKASIQEAVRREAFIFDEQFQLLKEELSLVYRSRNKARDLIDLIKSNNSELTEIIKSLENEFEEISSFTYSAKTVCPESIFHITHQYKNALRKYCIDAKKIILTIEGDVELNIIDLGNLVTVYNEMDLLYESLASEIHKHIGLK